MADIKKNTKNPKLDSKGDSAALVDTDSTEVIDDPTPPYLMKRINALKNVQLKMVNLESKFYEELHQLECKYAQFYEPLYVKRKDIVVGDYEPTEEEGKWALDEDEEDKEKDENKAKEEETEAEKTKGIENFWLETLQSFRITAEIIQPHDEPILSFLQDISCVLTNEKPYGYTLKFQFAENPYFTNKELTKTYELKTEVDPKDPFSFEGPDLNKTTGCKIDWKAGKNVTVEITKKKLKSKNKKAPAKIVHKEEKQDSFFNFFDTPKITKSAARKVPQLDEDNEEDQEELYLIADFEIGQYLREKVIPKAVLYYTGEYDGLDDDFEDYDDDEDDDEDDDDEDDDGEDDDDDEDEDDHKKPKKGHKKGHKNAKSLALGGKGGEPTPSECKQN